MDFVDVIRFLLLIFYKIQLPLIFVISFYFFYLVFKFLVKNEYILKKRDTKQKELSNGTILFEDHNRQSIYSRELFYNVLAGLFFLYAGFSQYNLDRQLTKVARAVSGKKVTINCMNYFSMLTHDLIFFKRGGFRTSPDSKQIFLYPRVCYGAKMFLDKPMRNFYNYKSYWFLTQPGDGTSSLHHISREVLLATEIEDKTEADCKAMQYIHRYARTMGASVDLAFDVSQDIYRTYLALGYNNSNYGILFSNECKPGEKWDLEFPEAPWNFI